MTPETDPRDLSLELVLNAPRRAIWRCWTEAPLLTQWFTPAPWTTPEADLDPRPGGRMNTLFRGPDGAEMRNRGVFLELTPHERLVFTDAFSEGWLPAAEPFMTGIIVLKDAGPGKTAYSALARHWTDASRDAHVAMGFEAGWTQAARQLEALAQSLPTDD